MSFFRKYVLHNAGLKLVALAAAILLWLAVAREPVAEVEVVIPVEFQNVPDNLEISSDAIPQAKVRVRGPARLVRDASQAGVHAVIDLMGSGAGEHTFELGPMRIQTPRDLRVMQVIPTRLQLELDYRASRQVPVHPRVVGAFASGIRMARVTADPESVSIVGPRKRVDAVDAAITDPVDATGVVSRQTFTSHVYVADPLVRVNHAGPVHVTVVTEKTTAQ